MTDGTDREDSREDRREFPAGLREVLEKLPDGGSDLVRALSGRVFDAQTLLSLMGTTCREAAGRLEGVHWAGVTAHLDGAAPFTVANTDERILAVDEWMYRNGDGPCLRSIRTGRRILMSAGQVSETWPGLAAAAGGLGVRSFVAQPLTDGERPVGSLNLYSGHDEPWTALDERLLAAFTQLLERGLHEYSRLLRRESAGQALRSALSDRTVVEQAIGVLMARYGFGPEYAYELLATQAQETDVPVAAHAARLLSGRKSS